MLNEEEITSCLATQMNLIIFDLAEVVEDEPIDHTVERIDTGNLLQVKHLKELQLSATSELSIAV